MTHYKRYLQWFFSILGLLAVPCLLNGVFLYRSGEFMSAEKVAHQQLSNEAFLASAATHDLTSPYKLALYREVKPEIVAIGSSRVMPFRQEMFQVPFINMSRAMNSIDQGVFLVDALLEIHVPKVVILALDYWWFTEPVQKHIKYYKPPDDKAVLSFNLLMKPFLWLFQKKYSWRYYVNVILQGSEKGSLQNVGLNAQIKHEGFAKDGSYYHVSIATGTAPPEDKAFKQTFEHIQTGNGFFGHYQRIQSVYIDRMQQLLSRLATAGVKTYVFIPPLAPSVYDQIQRNPKAYAYIADLFHQLDDAGIKVANFHDAQTIPSNDCEFLDGYHGGDVNYLKMLKIIAKKDLDGSLSDRLSFDYIDRNLEQFSNRVMIPNLHVTTRSEVDFLQLGCQKSEPQVTGT